MTTYDVFENYKQSVSQKLILRQLHLAQFELKTFEIGTRLKLDI